VTHPQSNKWQAKAQREIINLTKAKRGENTQTTVTSTRYVHKAVIALPFQLSTLIWQATKLAHSFWRYSTTQASLIWSSTG